MFNELKTKNPHIAFYHITDPAFTSFGKIIKEYPLDEVLSIMKRKEVPKDGNIYAAEDKDLMNTEFASLMNSHFYADIPAQVGYCNGNTDRLNALEYHKCSEIDIAATDLVLLLSDIRFLQNNHLPVNKVSAFYVPEGTAVELYGTTLHFAPCKVSDQGFKSIIVLTKGTNASLPSLPSPQTDEDKLIWMKNKWLIAHSESVPASKGAFVGIDGENIQIHY